MVSLSQLKKMNIEIPDILPISCQFCGRKLEPVGMLVNIFDQLRWVRQDGDYQDCNCQGARQYLENLQKTIDQKEQAKKETAYSNRVERMVKESKLGKRFRTRTFETFQVNDKNREAYQTAKQYTEKFKEYLEDGTGLLLTGTYGTGKTHLAAAICHELIKQGYQPIFGTMITLLGKIKATYSDDESAETEERIINTYLNCDLLIIDDLGKEKVSEWTLEKLYYVINSRYEDCLPIVITTNYDPEKLVRRLTVKDNFETAEAIVSRICETCIGVAMSWADQRKL